MLCFPSAILSPSAVLSGSLPARFPFSVGSCRPKGEMQILPMSLLPQRRGNRGWGDKEMGWLAESWRQSWQEDWGADSLRHRHRWDGEMASGRVGFVDHGRGKFSKLALFLT